MSKLTELKQQMESFITNNKLEKEQIDSIAQISKKIDECEDENKGLIDKNIELLNAYKSMIKSTSFATKESEDEDKKSEELTIEEIATKVISERK